MTTMKRKAGSSLESMKSRCLLTLMRSNQLRNKIGDFKAPEQKCTFSFEQRLDVVPRPAARPRRGDGGGDVATIIYLQYES